MAWESDGVKKNERYILKIVLRDIMVDSAGLNKNLLREDDAA